MKYFLSFVFAFFLVNAYSQKTFTTYYPAEKDSSGKVLRKPKKEKVHLTKREVEVLKLIALEHTTSEISAILHIADSTVETHRRNLIHKTGVRNTAGLVRVALEYSLID